jgi:hypothetical protein
MVEDTSVTDEEALSCQLESTVEVTRVTEEEATSSYIDATRRSYSRHKRTPATRTSDFLW